MKEKIQKEPIKLGLNGKPFSITLTKKPIDFGLRDVYIDARLSYLTKKTSKTICNMTYKGDMITAFNGKSSWNSPAYARLALGRFFPSRDSEYLKIGHNNKKEFIDYLISSKIIEFKFIN